MGKQIWKPGTVLYPLPVVMVSCGDHEANKDMNIITVAWTGTINSDPAMTYISVRPERYSHEIIKKHGEFVINLVTEGLATATDYCGVRSGAKENKFTAQNLTPVKSQLVKAPSIKESPVNIECRVTQSLLLGSHEMFLAEVVSVSVDDAYFDEKGKFCFEKCRPVCYSHGEYYGLGEVIGKFGYSVKKRT